MVGSSVANNLSSTYTPASVSAKQGRFAGVGVTDQCHGRYFRANTILPVHRAPAINLAQSRFQLADSLADEPAIGLELGFTRSAKPDSTLLTLEVSPATNQPRRQVPQLREFDLQLALESACALREYIENQTTAIQYPGLKLFFEIAFLART